jgi:hypothetical protein
MTTLFGILAVLLAGFLAWNLVPAGLNKLKNVDENLPTFTSLFGKFGLGALITVGVIEAFVPVFLVLDVALVNSFTSIFAGLIALVMFGATAVHVAVWKNSPEKPLVLFITSLLVLVCSALAV